MIHLSDFLTITGINVCLRTHNNTHGQWSAGFDKDYHFIGYSEDGAWHTLSGFGDTPREAVDELVVNVAGKYSNEAKVNFPLHLVNDLKF